MATEEVNKTIKRARCTGGGGDQYTEANGSSSLFKAIEPSSRYAALKRALFLQSIHHSNG